ncbi:MAG: hypothetical protein QMC03_02970 [Flavobacteriales bacterium]|mgnify:CR=1 FL=1|jgi:hypothetical protein|tara:strand:+ start:756 stop:1025 length:270 start_codon:yes stop_codon:yes gene_type:complete
MDIRRIVFVISFISLNVLLHSKVKAQVLISDTLINSVSQLELIEMTSLPIVQYGIDAYKIQYLTNDINGDESIASGLIVVPSNNNCSWG